MSTRGRKPELVVIEGGNVPDPRADVPASVPAELVEEFRNVVADLQERRIYTDAMLPTIETYVLAIGNMRAAQKAIDQFGVLVTGRDGTPKQNPAVSLLGKCNTAIQRLSAELGLTPASRSRKLMKEDKPDGEGGMNDLFDL